MRNALERDPVVGIDDQARDFVVLVGDHQFLEEHVQAGVGQNFAAITAAVVGGTLLSGGRGGVLHSIVGVLIVAVLANGLVLIGVSPYVQKSVQGVIVVAAVAITAWPLRARLRVVK